MKTRGCRNQEKAAEAYCQLVKEPSLKPAECELIKSDEVELWNATTLLICIWMMLCGVLGAFLEMANKHGVFQRWFLFFFIGTFATARGIDIRREDSIMLAAGMLALILSFALIVVAMVLRPPAPELRRENSDTNDGLENPFLSGDGGGGGGGGSTGAE